MDVGLNTRRRGVASRGGAKDGGGRVTRAGVVGTRAAMVRKRNCLSTVVAAAAAVFCGDGGDDARGQLVVVASLNVDVDGNE